MLRLRYQNTLRFKNKLSFRLIMSIKKATIQAILSQKPIADRMNIGAIYPINEDNCTKVFLPGWEGEDFSLIEFNNMQRLSKYPTINTPQAFDRFELISLGELEEKKPQFVESAYWTEIENPLRDYRCNDIIWCVSMQYIQGQSWWELPSVNKTIHRSAVLGVLDELDKLEIHKDDLSVYEIIISKTGIFIVDGGDVYFDVPILPETHYQ